MLDSFRGRVAGARWETAADDDAALVALARRDPDAFAALYARYFNPIYRYCYRRLADWDAAEDATSLIFSNALAGLPRCDARCFRSWLFAIAHNVVTDRYRDSRPEDPLATASDIPDHAASPEDRVIATEEARSLAALLAQLPADQRHVIELRLAGLTGVEIAHALDRSHGSVRKLQSRALARLRALMGIDTNHEEASNGNPG